MSEQDRDQKSSQESNGHRNHGNGPRLSTPIKKAKNFKGTLIRFLHYLKPYRLQLVVVLLTAVMGTFFSILSPKILGKATTKLFEAMTMKLRHVPGARVDFEYIWQIIMILAVIYVISEIFRYIQQFTMVGVSQRTVFDIRKDVSDKLSRLPLKFYDSHTHGEILSRVTNDIDNIASTLQQSMTQLISSLITIIGIVIMMFTISPLMTVITLVTLPLSFLVTAAVAKRSQKYFAAQQKELGNLNGHVEEMFTGHKIVKAFGREKESVQNFNEINQRLYDAGWKSQFVTGIIMPMMNFIGNIGYVIICVIGGVMVTKNTITIGDIQAFITYSKQFAWPITQTASMANVIQSLVASAERVFELLDEPEEIKETDENKVIEFPKGNIRFHNVKFRYNKHTMLIKNLNINVRQGQTVAIVGPTGAGKTTLVNLLMRFYEIDDGKISIDGVDIRDIQRGALRSMFGMVLQDTWLFNGTIKDNIAYGRLGATDEEVVEAAKAAHADHFIRTLPDGYNTILNEEASNISQGQKQLLTIARAILADPAMLILDEATSSVDTRTELYIQKAMTELMKGKTSFVIAHRLSTIRDADLILVMNEGSIVEQGTHNELLARGGFYASLYYSQFQGRNPDSEAI